MTQAEFTGYVRAFLASAAGGLMTNGILSADQFAMFTQLAAGIIVLAGTVIWSKYANNLTAMISHVAASPDVKQVITTPAIADAIPSSKVVDPAQAAAGPTIQPFPDLAKATGK